MHGARKHTGSVAYRERPPSPLDGNIKGVEVTRPDQSVKTYWGKTYTEAHAKAAADEASKE